MMQLLCLVSVVSLCLILSNFVEARASLKVLSRKIMRKARFFAVFQDPFGGI